MNDPFIFQYTESVAGPKEEIDKLESVNWRTLSLADDMGNVFEVTGTQRAGDNSLILTVYHDAEGEREAILGRS